MTKVEHVHAAEIVGYSVDATDGHVGKVDKRSGGRPTGYFVVSIGHVLTRRVTLPLSAVAEVDDDAQVVRLAMRTEEAKAAPEYVDAETAVYFDKPF